MRKWLVFFMTVLAIALVGIMGWFYMSMDRKEPEITIESSKDSTYRSDMTTEELLENVKAVDDHDGDVTQTLAVENVFMNMEAGEATVVYVAKDNSNNIAKKTYVMTIADGDSSVSGTLDTPDPQDEVVAPEAAQVDEENVSDETASEDSFGPAMEESYENMTEEEKYTKEEEEKIEQTDLGSPRFYLTSYYVELERGQSLGDRLSYVKNITDDKDSTSDLYRKIQITGNVDTYTAGTYELTYYVIDSEGHESNQAVLTVVVK